MQVLFTFEETAFAMCWTMRRYLRWRASCSVFMISFYIVMLAALVLSIGMWNRASIFGEAYWQALLLLEVMNVYDGVVIDKLWVGHSRFWVLPGLEDAPFVQTWRQVLKRRSILALIWVVGAAIVGGIVVLIF